MAGASSLTTALDKLETAAARIVGFAGHKHTVDVPTEAIENGRIIQEVVGRIEAMADKLLQAIPVTGVYADPGLLGGATGATGDTGATGRSGAAKTSAKEP